MVWQYRVDELEDTYSLAGCHSTEWLMIVNADAACFVYCLYLTPDWECESIPRVYLYHCFVVVPYTIVRALGCPGHGSIDPKVPAAEFDASSFMYTATIRPPIVTKWPLGSSAPSGEEFWKMRAHDPRG